MSSRRTSGLLVVNADDLGLAAAETDAILDAFGAGAISSATAMVWMRDSDRAAALARERGLPVGLHLNLIEPYTAPAVPPDVAAAQLRVVQRLQSARPGSRYVYHPRWRRDFERCVIDQLARFTELYGGPPTHFDGHRHLHLVPNALFARPLRSVEKCRRPVNRPRTESTPARHAARHLLYELVRRRFTTTRWCLSIRALHPALGGSGVEEGLQRTAGASVEIMVHPGWADERAVLEGREWRELVARRRPGSYAELHA